MNREQKKNAAALHTTTLQLEVLAEQIAQAQVEADKRHKAQLRVEGLKLRDMQDQTLRAFAEWWAQGWSIYLDYVEATRRVEDFRLNHSEDRNNPSTFAVHHCLDALPIKFRSLVDRALTASTLGTELASHSPLSGYVAFQGKDDALDGAIGAGIEKC